MTPAPVDHDERRARLTEVLLQVVAEAGLEAATVRNVAERAGVSIGTVQHYFKTKDDMLRHAYRTVGKELGDRAEQRAEGATSWKAAIRAVLLELLPLDERRAALYRVSVAFAARATWAPELAAELRKDLRELEDIFVDMLRQAGVPDAEREAMSLLALNAGLAEPLMYGDGTPEQVVEALNTYLDRIL